MRDEAVADVEQGLVRNVPGVSSGLRRRRCRPPLLRAGLAHGLAPAAAARLVQEQLREVPEEVVEPLLPISPQP